MMNFLQLRRWVECSWCSHPKSGPPDIALHCSRIKPFRVSHENMRGNLGATNHFPHFCYLPYVLLSSAFFAYFHRHSLVVDDWIIRWYLSMSLLWRCTLHSLLRPLTLHFCSVNECRQILGSNLLQFVTLLEPSFPV